MITVHRQEFERPGALPWRWALNLQPSYNQRPCWARLKTGHWMQVVQIEGDAVLGHVADWEAFSGHMAGEKGRALRVRIERNAYFILMLVCAAGLYIGTTKFVRQPVIGIPLLVVCGMGGLSAFKEWLVKATTLRRIAVCDPGIPPDLFPLHGNVRTDRPYGSLGGFADKDDAVRTMGGGPRRGGYLGP